jgi:hypothetical protein
LKLQLDRDVQNKIAHKGATIVEIIDKGATIVEIIDKGVTTIAVMKEVIGTVMAIMTGIVPNVITRTLHSVQNVTAVENQEEVAVKEELNAGLNLTIGVTETKKEAMTGMETMIGNVPSAIIQISHSAQNVIAVVSRKVVIVEIETTEGHNAVNDVAVIGTLDKTTEGRIEMVKKEHKEMDANGLAAIDAWVIEEIHLQHHRPEIGIVLNVGNQILLNELNVSVVEDQNE